jgi:hypothetical protein
VYSPARTTAASMTGVKPSMAVFMICSSIYIHVAPKP